MKLLSLYDFALVINRKQIKAKVGDVFDLDEVRGGILLSAGVVELYVEPAKKTPKKKEHSIEVAEDAIPEEQFEPTDE